MKTKIDAGTNHKFSTSCVKDEMLKDSEKNFKQSIKIAVIIFALIEALILLPLIYFKLAK